MVPKPMRLTPSVLHVIAQKDNPRYAPMIGQINGLVATVLTMMDLDIGLCFGVKPCSPLSLDIVYSEVDVGVFVLRPLLRFFWGFSVVLVPPCSVASVDNVAPRGELVAGVDCDGFPAKLSDVITLGLRDTWPTCEDSDGFSEPLVG